MIANSWANSPVLENALYGTLMIDNPGTGEIEYKLAEQFSITDWERAFTVVLRDGVQFQLRVTKPTG